MQSKYSKLVTSLGMVGTLFLAGCGYKEPDKITEIADIGGVKIYQETLTEVDKYALGATAMEEIIFNKIYEAEFDPEWQEEMEAEAATMEETVKYSLESYYDSVEEAVQEAGYESWDDYYEQLIIPAARQKVVIAHYVRDNKEEIYVNMRPSRVMLVETGDKEKAEEFVKWINNGYTWEDMLEYYDLEDKEVFMYTGMGDYSNSLVNDIFTTSTEYCEDVFEGTDTSTQDPIYYAYKILDNDPDSEDLINSMIDTFILTDSRMEDYQISLLQKYTYRPADVTMNEILVSADSVLTREDIYYEYDSEETPAEDTDEQVIDLSDEDMVLNLE